MAAKSGKAMKKYSHRPIFRIRRALLLTVLLLFVGASTVCAQYPTPPPANPSPPAPAPENQPTTPAFPTSPQNPGDTSAAAAKATAGADSKTELAIQDSGTTFRLRVNLVQVHVTVRDPRGKPVDNLRKEDFLLYDQGKLQIISTFAIETRQTRRAKAEAAAKTQVDEVESGKPAASVIPDRFVALVFDDTHFEMGDIANLRVQVGKFLDTVAPTDRVAIFSTSGELTHGFTSDKEQLKKTLLGLIPRARFQGSTINCPDVTFYEADQILNYSNTQVFNVDVQDTIQCAFGGDQTQLTPARSMVESAARSMLVQGETESQYAYTFMQDVIRRLAGMPGERVMVFVSPGFVTTLAQHIDLSTVVDLANRSNVVINALDGRGLYTPDLMGDVTKPVSTNNFQTAPFKATYRIDSQNEQAFVLGDLAYGTGGTFFHNSNDLAGGLQMIGAAPEVSYVLGFSPLSQKMDGQFHTLKVALTDKRKFTIQARRGYMSPKKFKDANEQAKQEIQDAVLSKDEILDFPLQIQTQYFKADDASVRLSVVSHLEIKGVHFRKADGRNWDNLTLATVIFDDNGNYVMGQEKLVTMKLLDNTYEKLSRSGIVVKSTFDVKPGRYMIRQVVRDSEGSQMAARNGAVDIPN
jgi:VWFA-related protein